LSDLFCADIILVRFSAFSRDIFAPQGVKLHETYAGIAWLIAL
jgi:hypothetical protein